MKTTILATVAGVALLALPTACVRAQPLANPVGALSVRASDGCTCRLRMSTLLIRSDGSVLIDLAKRWRYCKCVAPQRFPGTITITSDVDATADAAIDHTCQAGFTVDAYARVTKRDVVYHSLNLADFCAATGR